MTQDYHRKLSINATTPMAQHADRQISNRNRKNCWAARFIIVIGISAFRSHVAYCCLFPVFMQTNVTSTATLPGESHDRHQKPVGDKPIRDWRGQITDQHNSAGLVVTVNDDVMTVTARQGDKLLSSHSRQCVEAVGNNRFIVSQVDTISSPVGGEPVNVIRYTCVQFVRRAPDVAQLRIGPLADQPDRDLCSYDVIKLDPWLLVDHSSNAYQMRSIETRWSEQTAGVPCALRGGFGVRMYDRTGHQGTCDGQRGEIRMESDCERFGDGTYFHFRHSSCIPVGLYMYTTQQTICIANWVTGSFSFTMLRHNRLHYSWLLRYPLTPEESFTAYLFTDLVADTNERITETSNYIRMDTVRDTPRPATSLCVDEHDVCASWRKPCTSGPQMALACPRTCGLCNATRPTVCEFPTELIGSWYDGGSDPIFTVDFGQTTLNVKSQSGSRLDSLRCVRWNKPIERQLPSAATDNNLNRFRYGFEEMLVSETVDGCRPRYVCVKLIRKSPSVVYFRLSLPRQWPLTSSISDPIDCRGFSYEYDSADYVIQPSPLVETSNFDSSFRPRATGRGRHGFRFLVSREPRGLSVACRLPGGQLNNYSVIFRCAFDTVADCVGCSMSACGGGSADCLGTLSETASGTALRLTLSGCSHQTNRTEYLFDCRQSSRLVPSTDLVVVVSSSLTVPTTSTNGSSTVNDPHHRSSSSSQLNRTVYHCWVFPSGLPPALSVFYLFDGSQCDDAMRVIDFTAGMRIDVGLPRSSSVSSLFSLLSANSPSSLALATFTSKPRRSPREEEDLASVSVASGSRTVHTISVMRNSGHADTSGVSSVTLKSQPSTIGADQTTMTASALVVIVSVSLVLSMSQCVL